MKNKRRNATYPALGELSPENVLTSNETSRHEMTLEASEYVRAATSDNTRRAYQSDIQQFLKRGGQLPSTPEQLVQYLRSVAPNYNPRSLSRQVIVLKQWHQLKGYPDPTKDPEVIRTVRGITRLHGQPKKQSQAMRLEDLDKIIEKLSSENTLLAKRNLALILLGFFGAFRRSELAAIHWEEIHFEREGLIVQLKKSKTDQTGEGSRAVIPVGGEDPRSPILALIEWRRASVCYSGPVFRQITKSGKIKEEGICARQINRIVRAVAASAGLQNSERYSSHSLRRGFATEASRRGASMAGIQQHGRWRCTRTVVEYIEAGRQFADSAVNVLFGG